MIPPRSHEPVVCLTTQFACSRTILWLAIVMAGCTPTTKPPSARPENINSSPALTAPAHRNDSSASVEPTVPSENKLTDLLRLILQRLDIMPGVAQAKWSRQLPITDAKREAALLTKLSSEGVAFGLPESDVREFFQSQITAAKLVQEQLFKEWKARQQQPFPDAPDLEREVRPKIDDLNRQLLAALATCWSERSHEGWQKKLDQAKSAVFDSTKWSVEVVDEALRPLR